VKITFNIPEDLLADVMALAKKGVTRTDAIVAALREHVRRAKVEEVIESFGTFKNMMTQKELRAMREDRDKRHDAQWRGKRGGGAGDDRQLKLDRNAKAARQSGGARPRSKAVAKRSRGVVRDRAA
jgi:hypothetical protein